MLWVDEEEKDNIEINLHIFSPLTTRSVSRGMDSNHNVNGCLAGKSEDEEDEKHDNSSNEINGQRYQFPFVPNKRDITDALFIRQKGMMKSLSTHPRDYKISYTR